MKPRKPNNAAMCIPSRRFFSATSAPSKIGNPKNAGISAVTLTRPLTR